MSKKQTLELVLNVSGFTMHKFEITKGGSLTGYEFEAHFNGEFAFQVATDSFGDALRSTIRGIYETDGVTFEN